MLTNADRVPVNFSRDDLREVFLSEVSDESVTQGHAYDLGDDHGYFICELDRTRPGAGVEVLGKAASYEAAIRLAELYASASSGSS
jgi:hypothetical protein